MRPPLRATGLCSALLALAGGCTPPNDAAGDPPPVCTAGTHADGDVCVATLAGVEAGPALAQARDHHGTFAVQVDSGTYLFVHGGVQNMTTGAQAIERATIADDGSLGVFSTVGTAGVATFAVGFGVAVVDSFAVLTGGKRVDADGNVSVSDAVDVVAVDADGAPAFTTSAPLPFATFHGAAVAVGDRIYAVGGSSADAVQVDGVASAQLVGGVLQPWRSETQLPEVRSHHGLATDGTFLFVTGGLRGPASGAAHVDYDDVLVARLGADGAVGEWSTAGALPAPLAVHASFVHAGQLYVLGGLVDNADVVATISAAPIGADGAVGAFAEVGSLPAPRSHVHQAPLVGGRFYLTGGATLDGPMHVSHAETVIGTFE